LEQRLRAAELLMKKILPDLTAAEVTGANGGPIKTEQSYADLKDLSSEDLWTLREILMRCARPEGKDEGEDGANGEAEPS
jgi:hypothetical protein